MVHGSVDRAGASAPYNMALAGTPQKVNLSAHPHSERIRRGRGWSQNGRRVVWSYPLLGLAVDKLRLGAWVDCSIESFRSHVFGAHSGTVGKGRRRGSVSTVVAKVWTAPPGVEGGVYWQLTDEGRASRRLVCEFNPAKSDSVAPVVMTLRSLGVPPSLRGVWVDRVDAAFDFGGPRRAFVLDDRSRLADLFSVGPAGAQTERTGFRRGSRLKFQLYDKTAERQSAGADVRADVTRFEVQVLKPDRESRPLFDPPGLDETLPLADMGFLPWPGGDVTVRVLPYNPLAVADPLLAGFLSIVRGLGIRCALHWMKDVVGVRYQTLQGWMDLYVPEHDPSPSREWSRQWRSVAGALVDRLRFGMNNPFAVGI